MMDRNAGQRPHRGNRKEQRGKRLRYQEKSESLKQQRSHLEAQLLALQLECQRLDADNQVRLRQVEVKEDELRREKVKLAALEEQLQDDDQPSVSSFAQHAVPPPAARASRDGTPEASASTGSQDEVVHVVRSIPDRAYEVTRSMLEVQPRSKLEELFSLLMHTVANTMQQLGSAERAIDSVEQQSPRQTSGAVGQLEEAAQCTESTLAALVKDVIQLYCRAFRCHPKDTCLMSVRAANAMRGSKPAQSTREVQAVLNVSPSQERLILESIMRYLAGVKDSMDKRRKNAEQLKSQLVSSEEPLLQWESLASWLACEDLVGDLQTALAEEVDIYLEWSIYVFLDVLTPRQSAKFLMVAPLQQLLQVCMVATRRPPS